MRALCSRCWKEVPALPEQFAEYLKTAGEQIRWKRARASLLAELRTHLLDQRDACLEAGMEEDAAQAEALRQMGDPVMVGAELDLVHRPRPQWGLLVLTMALALAGGFLRVWLTAGLRYEAIQPGRTVLCLALGTAALLGGYFLDISFLGRHARGIYIAALAAGLLSLWLSPLRNYASYHNRYIVLCYPVVYAVWIYAWRDRGWKGLLASIAGGVPLVCIGLLTPYLLGVAMLLGSGFLLLLVAAWQDWFGTGRRASLLVTAGTAVALAAWAVWLVAVPGYGANRLLMCLHPELDPLGSGYQAITVRAALSGALWLGEGSMGGMFAGCRYEDVVPESGRDFLLTTMICKLGWLPFLVLMLVFAALVVWLLVRCLRQKNQLGRLVSAAVVLTLSAQAVSSIVLNLGVVLTSVSFPLVGGNLHSVLDMALIGLALSVFRQEQLPWEPDNAVLPPEHRPFISWRDGDLVIALGRRG